MNLASELTGSEQEILDVDMAQSPDTSTSAEHHSDTPLTVSESTSDTSASHPGTQHHSAHQPISQNSESLEISTAETTQPENFSEEHAMVNQSPQRHGAVSKGTCTTLQSLGITCHLVIRVGIVALFLSIPGSAALPCHMYKDEKLVFMIRI